MPNISSCETCGQVLRDGEHSSGMVPATMELIEANVRVECGGCGAQISMWRMKDEGHLMILTGRFFCHGCSHQLGFDRELNEK